MLVDVSLVDGMAVPVVDIVHVVSVRDRHVSTTLTVLVLVIGVFGVGSRLALIDVTVVDLVQVPVVDIVHVVSVRDRDMPTALTVLVLVSEVLGVFVGAHVNPLPWSCSQVVTRAPMGGTLPVMLAPPDFKTTYKVVVGGSVVWRMASITMCATWSSTSL